MLPFHNSAWVYLWCLQFFSPLFPSWRHNSGFGVFIAQCICCHFCPKLPNKCISSRSLRKTRRCHLSSCNLPVPSPGVGLPMATFPSHPQGRCSITFQAGKETWRWCPAAKRPRGGGECCCWGKEDQILWLCSSSMPEQALIFCD